MPKASCTRCGQRIDYDADVEGEEVICPGCDNITRLVSEEPESTSKSEPPALATPEPPNQPPALPQKPKPRPPKSAMAVPVALPIKHPAPEFDAEEEEPVRKRGSVNVTMSIETLEKIKKYAPITLVAFLMIGFAIYYFVLRKS